VRLPFFSFSIRWLIALGFFALLAGWTDVGGRWRVFRAMVRTVVVPMVEAGKLWWSSRRRNGWWMITSATWTRRNGALAIILRPSIPPFSYFLCHHPRFFILLDFVFDAFVDSFYFIFDDM
jgi:hypothetical protein